jgi:UDP-3-O-[3-hydroxymyristoyl] glucosamine N-acyltransferase
VSPAYSVGELAKRIGAELVGDASCTITGIASLDTAGPGDLSYFADTKLAGLLAASPAPAVIVRHKGDAEGRIQLVAPDPYLALRGAILAFHKPQPEVVPGVSPQAMVSHGARVHHGAQVCAMAVIEPGAEVAEGACVGAGSYVGEGCVVAKDTYLYPRVTLYRNVKLGERVMVHSGAVLGADGFGYAQSQTGALKVPQVGSVVVEDDVEIGANTTIDRGTLGATRIGKGTKIDNLVMIAHNVQIGQHCIIVSQVGIAGSTRVGNGVIIAGQVGIVDHIEIGDGAVIGAGSGVSGNLTAGKTYLGSPAREISETKRIFAYMARFPEWAKRLRALEEQLSSTIKS